jgi:hypothetical protein
MMTQTPTHHTLRLNKQFEPSSYRPKHDESYKGQTVFFRAFFLSFLFVNYLY